MSDDGLPEGWCNATVADLGRVLGGKRLPKGHDYEPQPTSHPYIRVTDFENMTIQTDELRYLSNRTAEELWRYTISSSDLYISIAGSIGKVGMVPESLDGGNLTENAAKLANLRGIRKEYLCFYLNSASAQSDIADSTKATGQPKLALFRIEQLPVPVPPLPEQHRIVEKVESLLNDVNAARDRLSKVPKVLKRFRQAVLAAACSGRLTEEWRVHRSPAALPRTDVEADGLPELPDFPEGWGFGPLETVTERFQYGTSDKADADDKTGVPVLRMSNIQDGVIDLSDLKYIKHGTGLEPFLVRAGDVLFNRTNSPELVGKTAVVTSADSPCCRSPKSA